MIENLFDTCLDKVHERFYEAGKMSPQGLRYHESRPNRDGKRCCQLMETGHSALLSAVGAEMGEPGPVRDH